MMQVEEVRDAAVVVRSAEPVQLLTAHRLFAAVG
jgi:hypothetical protein